VTALGDWLTQFNGTDIVYDGIGNPIKIGDAEYNNTDIQLTWNGRELESYELREAAGIDEYGDLYFDTTTYSFTYNKDGIRTSKTVNGVVHEYILNGDQITAETWKAGSKEYLLIFLYDANGLPIGMKYWTTGNTDFSIYFFEKNLQGDIVAVYNSAGAKIGSYTYDAWGNHTYTTASGTTGLERKIVSTYNPFRYRGYFYDVETQWYYLQTRYYNPNWGRFINADGYINANGDIIGFNMYAYCNNNLIAFVDSEGTAAKRIELSDKADAPFFESAVYQWSDVTLVIMTLSRYRESYESFKAQYPDYIYAIDKRYCSDDCDGCNPNIQILDSYKYTDRTTMLAVINCLIDYESNNPLKHRWDRTPEDLYYEWYIHNEIYNYFGITNCRDVDLDTEDSGKGFIAFAIEYILGGYS